MDTPFGYPEKVWTLFRDTPRAGRFAPDTPGLLVGEAGSQAGRDRLRLELQVTNGTTADSRFQAHGCPYTIAVGAWLAGWCVGRPLADFASAPVAELRAALEIPEDRAHCWLMAQDVLRALNEVSK